MQLGAAGLASGLLGDERITAGEAEVELKRLVGELEYLTQASKFGTVERGNPLPYTLPPEKLKAVGLTRDTWQLDVVPDPESSPKVERTLRKSDGTALDFAGLMKLADKHAVRLEEPIKTLGFYEVPVRLHPDVTATLKLVVAKA